MAEQLYKVPEAAQLLGLTEGTLWNWIGQKKIEVVRRGTRYVRIKDSTIIKFQEDHTEPAMETIQ